MHHANKIIHCESYSLTRLFECNIPLDKKHQSRKVGCEISKPMIAPFSPNMIGRATRGR